MTEENPYLLGPFAPVHDERTVALTVLEGTLPDDLNGVYSEIADELASQYTLGYSSKNAKRDGAYRRIVVQIARTNVQPRTKRGYYAPTSR